MNYNHLRSRIRALEIEHPEPGPWPPGPESKGSLLKLLYDELIMAGVEMPQERPEDPLMFMLKKSAELVDWSEDCTVPNIGG